MHVGMLLVENLMCAFGYYIAMECPMWYNFIIVWGIATIYYGIVGKFQKDFLRISKNPENFSKK